MVTNMLICDWCSKGWHMGCLVPHWKKYLLKNGFALGALSRINYLFMWLVV